MNMLEYNVLDTIYFIFFFVVQAPNEPFPYIFNVHVIRKETNERFPYTFRPHCQKNPKTLTKEF